MAGIREGGRAPSGPFLSDLNGNPLSLDTSNQFVNVRISVSPDGKFDMYYKDIPIFQNVQLPNYTPFVGANFAFGGNTGGANENAWIDDLCINSFSLGDVAIVAEPADATINEPGRVMFTVGVDGLPPFGVQWFSNEVAIAGANALTYMTPLLNRTADGAGYFAVITNQFASVTSRVATVTVTPDVAAPVIVSALADCMGSVYVRFNETLDATSAAAIANYTINNGITVNSATLLPGNLVRLAVSPNPQPLNHSILSVTGVLDRVGFNSVSTSIVISVKAPIAASGPDNMLVFEAEDYDVNISPAPQTPSSTWTITSSLPGANRGAYVEAMPNTGAGGGDTPNLFTNASQLQYCINVPVAGRYYLWARGSSANDGANNSFHFGIDGVSPDEFTRRVGNAVQNWGLDPDNVNKFGWVRDANGTGAGSLARIDIATPGLHTFNVWMREDGMRLDTFILTTNAAFTLQPTEAGPSGVVRSGTQPALAISRALDGTVTITWPGTGWTLQATDELAPNPGNTEWQDQPFQSPVTIPPGFFGPGNSNVFFRVVR
jgi:hypothetical protein